MSLLGQTNWNDVEGQQPAEGGWEPIPNGTYYFQISDVQDKPTRNGTGSYVEITFDCLNDSYKGQNVKGRYNLVNSNQTAVNIARKQLKALGDALGVIPSGAEVLVGKVLKLEVSAKPRADDPSKFTNEIERYLPSGGAPPNPQMEAKAAAAVPAGQDDTPF